jgi:hypothetical protein
MCQVVSAKTIYLAKQSFVSELVKLCRAFTGQILRKGKKDKAPATNKGKGKKPASARGGKRLAANLAACSDEEMEEGEGSSRVEG